VLLGGGPARWWLTVGVALGCSGGPSPSPAPPAPGPPPAVAGVQPADTAPWLDDLLPVRPLRYVIRWRLETPVREVRGRAEAILAPPDTLRFEYRAPFGRRGTALIIGGAIARADPEDDVRHLIRAVPLFWAALGIPWTPGRGRPVGGDRLTWRVEWGDTVLTYVRRTGTPPALTAQLTAAGEPVGSSYASLDRTTGQPTDGRVQIAAARALLWFRIERIDPIGVD
jgi:hypothetical protein